MATEIAKYKFGSYRDQQAAYNNLDSKFEGGFTTDSYSDYYYIIIYDTIKDANLAGKICQASGGILYDKGSSGGCFITTATLTSTNQKDDGVILTNFRNFRDTWLLNQPDGKKIIEEYYECAPKIVANIDSHENSKNIYQNIYTKYLSNCYNLIEEKKFKKAFKKYYDMVVELKAKYL